MPFFRKLEKMSQNLSSAAVVIGALRVKGDMKIKMSSDLKFGWCFKGLSSPMSY